MRRIGLAAAAMLLLSAAACAQSPSGPAATPITAAKIEGAPIQIVSPAQPLKVTAVVRPGSFVKSRVSPEGMVTGFADALRSARVFAAVLEAFPPGGAFWEVQLAASDYGEQNAYTLELSAVLLRQQKLLNTYTTKQTIRQPTGLKSQLTIGPPELGQLAERAIQDLVRQIAADSDRLAKL